MKNHGYLRVLMLPRTSSTFPSASRENPGTNDNGTTVGVGLQHVPKKSREITPAARRAISDP
jgi:hypothetical protein